MKHYLLCRFDRLTTLVNCVQHSLLVKRALLYRRASLKSGLEGPRHGCTHTVALGGRWEVLLLVVRDFVRLLEPVTKRLVALPQFVCAASWMQNASKTERYICSKNPKSVESSWKHIGGYGVRELIKVYLNGIIMLAVVRRV